jgi:hypothetical protein
VTTFDLFRRAGVAAAVLVSLASLAACSGKTEAAPAATESVTASPSAAASSPTPAGSATPSAAPTPAASPSRAPVFDSAEDDDWPPISDKTPPIFGTVFQSDPGHDFTRGISPSRDGIVRAELRTMQAEDVVEYVPVKWVKDTNGQTAGHFEGPPEGDVTAWAAPFAKNVVFLSALGCKGGDVTIDGKGLGTERCSRDRLISQADESGLFALVTVKRSQIVKVVQIYTP